MVHSGDMAYDIDDNCTADVMWTEAHSLVSGGVVQSSRLFKPKPGDPRVYGLEKLFREYGVDISFGGHTYYT